MKNNFNTSPKFFNRILRKKYLVISSIYALACIFFYVGWSYSSLTFLLFLFLSIILFGDSYLAFNRTSWYIRFLFLIFTFFIINYSAIYWLPDNFFSGTLLISLVNSVMMSSSILAFQFLNRNHKSLSYIFFISYWLSMEFMQYKWEFSFPHLNLGNGLANWVEIIQWYDFTGVLGGSFWILTVNLFIYTIFTTIYIKRLITLSQILILMALLALPPILSFLKNNSVKLKVHNETTKIMLMHTSLIDRSKRNQENLIDFYLKGFNSINLSSIDYAVLPETAVQGDVFFDEISNNERLIKFRGLFTNNPNLNIIIGCILKEKIESGNFKRMHSNSSKNPDFFFYKYNAAIKLDHQDNLDVHTKQKLVPKAEIELESWLLSPIKFLTRKYTSANFYFKKQSGNTFQNCLSGSKFSVFVCYETLFGEYVSKSALQGAEFITFLMNEEDFTNPFALRFALNQSKLRAIETRRSIARCSNMGISCFIDRYGKIVKYTNSLQPTTIIGTINLNNKLTFYSKNGNYIGRTAILILILFGIYLIIFESNRVLKK